jgi:transposase
VHDRIKRAWRHLDFFEYEAWLHAQVPRIACTACGKTTQMDVPWAREGSGFSRHLPRHLHPQVSFIIRGVAQIHES